MIGRIRRWWDRRRARAARNRLQEGIKLLRRLDILMRRAGMSRPERRQTWREMANSAEDRDRMLNKLAARLGIDEQETSATHTQAEAETKT